LYSFLTISYIAIDACQKLSFLLTEEEKEDTYLASNLLQGVIINLLLKKERKQNKRAQEKNHHSGYIKNSYQEKSFPQDFPTKIKLMLAIFINMPFDSNFVTWVLFISPHLLDDIFLAEHRRV
jgi:hypothetical protein